MWEESRESFECVIKSVDENVLSTTRELYCESF